MNNIRSLADELESRRPTSRWWLAPLAWPLMMVAMLSAAQPSAATCPEGNAKEWSSSPTPITISTAEDPNRVNICRTEPFSVSVSASDTDHWKRTCTNDSSKIHSEGDEGDTPTYSWGGGGNFGTPTQASSTWTPAGNGPYNLTCTIDDSGQKGNDSAITFTVRVCVVDPGTPPTSVSGADTKESPGTPVVSPGLFGSTDFTSLTVEAQAKFDCNAKIWKGVVTKAVVDYSIWWDLAPGYSEASAAAVTKDNYCVMLGSLSSRAARNGWWMKAAVGKHERVHADDLKRAANKFFPDAKAKVEALTVAHTCGKTAATASGEIQAQAATAISEMQTDMLADWQAQGAFDHQEPHGRCSLAERTLIDPVVADIKAIGRAATPPWTCP